VKITLTEWGSRNYSPPPSIGQLKTWVRTGQIFPAPERVGRTWMLDEKSARVPLVEYQPIEQMSKRALSILKSS